MYAPENKLSILDNEVRKPLIMIPGLKPGNLSAFEVGGDSMAPLLMEGDIVIGRKVGRLKIEYNNKICVISTVNGLFVKRIFFVMDDNGWIEELLLVSDNKSHEKFHVKIEDVISIWKVERKISKVE